ncbi:MAG: TIGR00269 family protein [Candidatus Woesearchaeota archaeon]
MKCVKCNRKAVFLRPSYCKTHFLAYIEKKVMDTIKRYRLLEKTGKVIVAASGGKDSISCAYILKKLGYNIEVLAIDEGIAGYRNHTISDLRRFCKEKKIKLNIIDIGKTMGRGLDSLVKESGLGACTLCGAIRRYAINRWAKKLGACVVATGHNLDDEVQAIMMNFLRNNLAFSARIGPVTGLKNNQGFIRRVKPLYLCTEKEIAAYAFLRSFRIGYNICPYTNTSYRYHIQELLNDIEKKIPNTKKNIINNFLSILPILKKRYETKEGANICKSCGEPCSKSVCRVCSILAKNLNKPSVSAY